MAGYHSGPTTPASPVSATPLAARGQTSPYATVVLSASRTLRTHLKSEAPQTSATCPKVSTLSGAAGSAGVEHDDPAGAGRQPELVPRSRPHPQGHRERCADPPAQ